MVRLYNTLSKRIEDFKPLHASHVGVYSCGPTVYDYQHIGHMRRYVGDDILVRVLKSSGYTVKHVMNITDVGHLVSDADTGEDKMEKGAKKFNKSVWELAKMFERQFRESSAALNIQLPQDLMHATDYISDQIELIKILEEKGFTYKIADGIYFDSSTFDGYAKLSGQKINELRAGARVEMVAGKRHPTDFALWKFSGDSPDTRRQMEWDSPWGKGFPGWHIECSAMAMKALGPTLDIHTGGIDHIPVHHTNEIAQSEASSGKQFVRYFVHHNFLLVNEQKMSKSIGNVYTVQDIAKKSFDPLALRYFYLQAHYRQELNFTFEALAAAQTAYGKLLDEVSAWDEPKIGCAEFEQHFMDALFDDLNTPKALAVLWEMVKSDYPTSAKAQSVFKFDEILGLNVRKNYEFLRQNSGQAGIRNQEEKVPDDVMELVKEREGLRKQKRYHLADQLRNKIKKLGFEIRDEDGGGTTVRKLKFTHE